MKEINNSQIIVPNFSANSGNFGIEQSKHNDHFQNLAGGSNGSTVGRHKSNPY